jgi:hypothetical protein
MEEVPEIGGVQTEEEETMSKEFQSPNTVENLKTNENHEITIHNTPKNINQSTNTASYNFRHEHVIKNII